MESKYRNIYENARRAAGMTQERWAEAIGCSVDSVRLYESGRGLPSDDIVIHMADISGMQSLCVTYMRAKSSLAATLLPQVSERTFTQAVCTLVHRICDFSAKHRTDDLLKIASDGHIDDDEHELFNAIYGELEGVIKAAIELKYAREEYYDD